MTASSKVSPERLALRAGWPQAWARLSSSAPACSPWRRLVLPNGSSIVVDNLPGTDAAGYAGLSDRVDHHWGRILAGVGLATRLGVGTELSFGTNEDELVEAVRESIQGATSQAGQRIVDRNLGIQPTIRVRPGWPVRVIVAKDLVLRPYREVP